MQFNSATEYGIPFHNVLLKSSFMLIDNNSFTERDACSVGQADD